MKKYVILTIVVLSTLVSCQSNDLIKETVKEQEAQILALESTIKDQSAIIDTFETDAVLMQAEKEKIEAEVAEIKSHIESLTAEVEEAPIYADDQTKELRVVSVSGETISYIYVDESDAVERVSIIGDQRPDLSEVDDLEYIDFGYTEGGKLEITVFGSIYNVRLVQFEFNEDFSEKSITEVEASSDEIKDSVLVVYSHFPEGIPYEMLIWENEDGEEKTYVIAGDGYGFDGHIILN